MSTDLSAVTGRTSPLLARPRTAADPAGDFRSLVAAVRTGDMDGARAALQAVCEGLQTPMEPAIPAVSKEVVQGEPLAVLDQLSYSREKPVALESRKEGIDYNRFSGMTPFQVYMANPAGLPQGWSWGAWAEATGQPNPENLDVSGAPLAAPAAPEQPFERTQASFDWNRTGAYLAREGADGSVHTMTIQPPPGWTGGIELFGSQGSSGLGSVSSVQYTVTDASGVVVASENLMGSAGDIRFAASGAKGPYTVTVTYSGAGLQNFNCLHMP